MGSARAVTMCGTLDGMEHGQKLTVFLTNNLFLSLHEGTVTPRSVSLSVTETKGYVIEPLSERVMCPPPSST